MMDLNPIIRPTGDAFMSVAGKGLKTPLLPFAYIGRGFAAAPKMAMCATAQPGSVKTAADSRACAASIAFHHLKFGLARDAITCCNPAFASPTASPIASLATIGEVLFRSGAVSAFAALWAYNISSVPWPSLGSALQADVPGGSLQVIFTATCRTINLGCIAARNWGRASFAWMGLGSHSQRLAKTVSYVKAEYIEIARARVAHAEAKAAAAPADLFADAPLLADVA